MRKLLIVASLLLVAVVITGAVMLTSSGMPLAWRGALTRHAYAELARGHLPPLRCTPTGDGAAVRRDSGHHDSTRVMPLAVGRQRCEGGSVDGGVLARLELEDGWVYGMERVRWVPAALGAAFTDSLARAVSRERGAAPVRCRIAPRPERGDAEELHLYWGPDERSPFTVELRASSVTRRAGATEARVPPEWVVLLDAHHRESRCVPA